MQFLEKPRVTHGFFLPEQFYRQASLGRRTEVCNECIILKILDFIYLGINDLDFFSSVTLQTSTHFIDGTLKNTNFAFVRQNCF